jgi:subtilisin family serine protease
MDARNQHKLDPRLRRLVKRRVARPRTAARKKGEGGTAQVFVEVANAEAAKWLEHQAWVKDLVQVVDGYYTASVPHGGVAALAAHDGVIEVEAVKFFRTHLDKSLISIHGKEKPISGGGVPDGKGVVTGFVDYGLDFTQKDFQNPARSTTRIAWLWDQQLKKKRKEKVPPKYGYGVEYSSKEIDYALRKKRPKLIRHNPLSAKDIAGHGTHVAGIAAGNGETSGDGYPPKTYIGVAPAATIVFVNLNRQEMIEQVNAPRGTLANSVNIAHGVAYCFEKAAELGMPCVVNLSLGCNGGGHDGDMALEWIIDALLRKPGRAVVVAAGNEDGEDRRVHATGTLKKGKEAELHWEIGWRRASDPNPNELEVWYPRGSAIKARLVAPDHRASDWVIPGQSGTFRFAKGERVSIYSDPQTPWDGAARIHIELEGASRRKGIRFGTWTVKLQAISVAKDLRGPLRFDAWIERTLPAVTDQPEADSRFRRYDPDTAINLTTPSTARLAISVASCHNLGSLHPTISGFSGRGPTRDGRPKPELSAPGQPVTSTNACAGGEDENGGIRPARRSDAGTSMAAPHVSGVVARILSRNAYLTAEEIRDILVKSATPPDGRTQWGPKWGYGKLNAARAVELVERLGGSKSTAFQGRRRIRKRARRG